MHAFDLRALLQELRDRLCGGLHLPHADRKRGKALHEHRPCAFRGQHAAEVLPVQHQLS